eukprot:SAG11_NODE_162_length_13962_cov_19.035562_4_plen_98_part_00
MALHHAPYNLPYGAMSRTEFNYARFHIQHLRMMALASSTALRPWLAFRSYGSKVWDCLPSTGPTDFWQEMVIHAGLTVGAPTIRSSFDSFIVEFLSA